jgi:hypothetical protein
MNSLLTNKKGKYYQMSAIPQEIKSTLKKYFTIKKSDLDSVYNIVTGRYNAKKSVVNSYLKVQNMLTHDGVTVKFLGRKISTTDFFKQSYRYTIGGAIKNTVMEKIYKDRPPEILPHHFYARFKKINGVHAFVRKSKHRYPVSLRLAPAVPNMLGSDSIVENVSDELLNIAQSKFEQNFYSL